MQFKWFNMAVTLAVLLKLLQTNLTARRWTVSSLLIFKKGNRSDPSNYRPISLTSVCCKVLEHIIYSNIISHLESYNVLSNSQFGFRAKRSAEQQLLRTIHDFALNLNNKTQTDVILLDFCKAFDKVSHCLLLRKFDHYGIRGPTFE